MNSKQQEGTAVGKPHDDSDSGGSSDEKDMLISKKSPENIKKRLQETIGAV